MRLRYTLRAQTDLDAIFNYLDRRAPAAARAVKEVIERRISRLAEFPFMAPATDEPGIYELTIVRYPYKVHGEEVGIMHIRDARRRLWEGE
jgi:plasmid stabilization system protein ParE